MLPARVGKAPDGLDVPVRRWMRGLVRQPQWPESPPVAVLMAPDHVMQWPRPLT